MSGVVWVKDQGKEDIFIALKEKGMQPAVHMTALDIAVS